jgi:hypothetical protein
MPKRSRVKDKDERGSIEVSSPSSEARTNMGFNIQITFEGLCVFVPGPRCGPPNVMRVLLPNACSGLGSGGSAGMQSAGVGGPAGMSNSTPAPSVGQMMGGAATGMAAGSAMPPHLPFVAVDYDQIQDDSEEDGLDTIGQAKANATALCPDLKQRTWWDLLVKDENDFESGIGAVHLIDWEDLSIVSESSKCDLQVKGGRVPGSQEPGPSEQADFSWVAELDQAAPGSGEIDPHCFDADPPRNLVIGRIRLTTGTILVTNLAATGTGRAIWEFRCAQSGMCTGYSQALASEVTYITHIDGDSVTLCLRRFRAGTHPGVPTELTLAPTSAEPVRIVIGNLPLTDVLAFPHDQDTPSAAEQHFRLLYQLSLTPPLDPPIPSAIAHPTKSKGGLTGVRGGTIICPGGSGKASDLA